MNWEDCRRGRKFMRLEKKCIVGHFLQHPLMRKYDRKDGDARFPPKVHLVLLAVLRR